MALSISNSALKARMDGAQPGTLADAFRIIKIGSVIRALLTFLRKKAPAASAYELATLQALVLPDDAKAQSLSRVFVRAGAANGEFAVVAPGTTPTTGQAAVSSAGNIVFLAADAVTNADVSYQPDRYDAFEATRGVVANVLSLPAAYTDRGVIAAFEVESLAGGSVGKKIVLAPGAGAPAAGQARLNIAKTTVTFAGADAVTSARVKFSVASATDVDALLEAASSVM